MALIQDRRRARLVVAQRDRPVPLLLIAPDQIGPHLGAVDVHRRRTGELTLRRRAAAGEGDRREYLRCDCRVSVLHLAPP